MAHNAGAKITIGGTANYAALVELEGIAQTYGIMTDWNGATFRASDAEGEGGPLVLYKVETSDGRLPAVEAWCERHRLPFRLFAEANDGDDPFLIVSDGKGDTMRMACNAAEEAVLTIAQARTLTWEQTSRLEELSRFQVPPFRMASAEETAAPADKAGWLPEGYAGAISPWQANSPDDAGELTSDQTKPWPISLVVMPDEAILRIHDPARTPGSARCMDHVVSVEVQGDAVRLFAHRLDGAEGVRIEMGRDGIGIEMPNGISLRTPTAGRGKDATDDHGATGTAVGRGPLGQAPNAAQRILLAKYPNVGALPLPGDPNQVDAAVRSHGGVGDDLFRFMWVELAECDDAAGCLRDAAADIEAVLGCMPEDAGGITWEVIGYEDEAAYDDRQGTCVDESIPSRSKAMRIGRDALATYGKVKVQTSDREEIAILTAAHPDGE